MKTLSKKICNWSRRDVDFGIVKDKEKGWLDIKDIKQFIKEIKEMKGIEHDGSFISCTTIRDFIDNLAGKELIE